jgi:AAA family ATP:ADP antiporter
MSSTRSAVVSAAAASAAMIAFQVAGKATRDALFLSSYPIRMLPSMVIASAVLSVLAMFWAVRRMSVHGPWRFIPALFAASTVLLLAEWALVGPFRGLAAVLVYLHFTVLGALLISGFWSMVNERFDPRTAKRQIGRIGAAGTIGGLVGGLLAERMASMFTMDLMLPLLALLHLLATIAVRRLRATQPPRTLLPSPQAPASILTGLRLMTGMPYLRNLILLVILTTVSEGLLDFVFKGRAALQYGTGEQLLRLFAVFYTGVSLLTFMVQSSFGRVVIERLGLAGAVGTLPAAVGVTGLGAIFFPGLPTAALSRGTEAVFHNSLFRSGYELLFTPIPRDEKRATKTMVDVGAVRLGDIIGGGIVQASLLILPRQALGMLLGIAVFLALAALLTSRSLQQGYRQALEKSLIFHGLELDVGSLSETMEHPSVYETVSNIDLRRLRENDSLDITRAWSRGRPADAASSAPLPNPEPVPPDPLIRRSLELRSGDRRRVLAALTEGPITPEFAPPVIPLLAWDDVARAAAEALRVIASRITGQLIDAMLDPDQEFAVRRRIPGILASAPSERTVEGLMHALADRRFEVRYRAGRALARIHQSHPELTVDAKRAFEAVIREVSVDRQIWESQRLLDDLEDAPESPDFDNFLKERAGRSMEHVFTILSLALPGAPLKIALRGLYTEDDILRGTALEYLENALPESVRSGLWPFLEDRRPRRPSARDREAIIADLLRSNESISLNLAELRRRAEEGRPS